MAEVQVTAGVLTDNDSLSQNSQPLVSVIIPVYKVEAYLRECVDSVIAQIYRTIEIILVDDGSPDSCPAICDEYAVKDERVRVIHKANGGLSDARNAGINIATGEWICFVDSDDKIANSNVFLKLVDYLQTINSPIVYCSSMVRFSGDGIPEYAELSRQKKLYFSPNELFEFTKKNHFIFAAWLFVVKRSFIIQKEIYFTKGLLHEDMDWIPRLLCAEENVKISVFTKQFYFYRCNPNSITSTFSQNRLDSMKKILSNLSVQISKKPKNKFLKKWFNMNLYNIVICLEYYFQQNTSFYKLNSDELKKLIKKNFLLLNLRNIFFYASPKLFYHLRSVIKDVRRCVLQ